MSPSFGKVEDIESFFAALFALVVGNAPQWQSELAGMIGFQNFSRIPVPPSRINPAMVPVLFQEEQPFELSPAIATIGGRYKYKLRVDLVAILACNGIQEPLGAETNLPTRELNRALMALLLAIAPPYPGAKQTLGGLVDSVYVEGRVERIVGLPGDGMQLSVGILPVTILTI